MTPTNKYVITYYMFLAARSLWTSPFLVKWYIPRATCSDMKTRSCVVR